MILLLAKALGLKEFTKWGLWGLRLVIVSMLLLFALALLVIAGVVLHESKGAREAVIVIVALGLGVMVFRAILARRKDDTYVGERTIDGKVVPEKLAAAALRIPRYSPDGEYVLRGLPDYGKVLLKLNSSDFEYLPELAETTPEVLPVEEEEPAASRAWLPPWVMVTSAAALLVVAALAVYQTRGDFYKHYPMPRHYQMPQRESAAEAGKESATAPPPLETQRSNDAPIVAATPQAQPDGRTAVNKQRETAAAPPPLETSRSNNTPRVAATPEVQPLQAPSAKSLIQEGRKHMQNADVSGQTEESIAAELEEATNDFRQGAESGDPDAKFMLALMYVNKWKELKISEDVANAKGGKLFMQLAQQGYQEAEYMVGVGYMQGVMGFPKDHTLARQWLENVVNSPARSAFKEDARKALKELNEELVREYREATKRLLNSHPNQ